MAFKSSTYKGIDTSEVSIFTASTTITVIGLSICNTTTSDINVHLALRKNGSPNNVWLLYGTVIPAGTTLIVGGGDQKLVLESGDSLRCKTSAANGADVIINYLEV